MKRILAHKIIYKGHIYKMSVVSLVDDKIVSILPFKKETAETIFYSGTLDLDSVELQIP